MSWWSLNPDPPAPPSIPKKREPDIREKVIACPCCGEPVVLMLQIEPFNVTAWLETPASLIAAPTDPRET